MEQLLALDRTSVHTLWESVWGDRLYHWLRGAESGDDGAPVGAEVQKSLGHSHVLAPEHRTLPGAWAVAHKLLHKAAMRLRMEGFYAGSMAVTLRYQLRREQAVQLAAKRHTSGIRHAGWAMEARFQDSQDTLSLLEVLRSLWKRQPEGAAYVRPFFVGITLKDLVPEARRQATLFDATDHRGELSTAMDRLNLKYGHTTLHFAGMLPAREAAPTRIAFTQIPVQYGVDYM
jgi:DNA polymerase-4